VKRFKSKNDRQGQPPVAGNRSVRFTSVLEQSRNKLWGAHLAVPDEVVERLAGSGSRRVLCTLNASVEYPSALVPRGDGSFVIRVNKRIREKFSLGTGSRLRVVLRRDESRYGLPMPEELDEELRQDGEGHRLFHPLTAGRQRTLLYLVDSAKGADTRIKRAVAVVRHLKTNHGRLNYKQLNDLIRRG